MLAASIGVGSFLFHTCANHSTMWLDIIPISLFQVAFLWLAGRYMVQLPTAATLGLIVVVIGLSFAAMQQRVLSRILQMLHITLLRTWFRNHSSASR